MRGLRQPDSRHGEVGGDISNEIVNEVRQFGQQKFLNELASVEQTLEEGDIIIINDGKAYYVAQEDHKLLIHPIIDNNYLPEAAVPFLIKKKVVDRDDLRELYPMLNPEGFIWRYQEIQLASKDSNFKRLEIQGWTFKEYLPAEARLSTKTKRQPLTRKSQRP